MSTELNFTQVFRPIPIKIFTPVPIFQVPLQIPKTTLIFSAIPSPKRIQVQKPKTPQKKILVNQQKPHQKKVIFSKTRPIKKLDKSLTLLTLNQIEIFKQHIKHFPLIDSLSEEDLQINLLTRMLFNENYFNVINKEHLQNDDTLIISASSTKITDEFHKKLLQDKTYDKVNCIFNSNDSLTVSSLIKSAYHEMKETLLEMQKNYIGKKKKMLNENLQKKVFQLVVLINEIYDEYFSESESENSTNISSKSKKKFTYLNQRKEEVKSYKCIFCEKIFLNGQGLGGHISRIHPNQSEKYKMKIEIRNKRKEKREKIFLLRKFLFNKYNLDYDLLNDKKEKEKIAKFLSEHKQEYFLLKKRANKT